MPLDSLYDWTILRSSLLYFSNKIRRKKQNAHNKKSHPSRNIQSRITPKIMAYPDRKRNRTTCKRSHYGSQRLPDDPSNQAQIVFCKTPKKSDLEEGQNKICLHKI
jgi:hypothetical protein